MTDFNEIKWAQYWELALTWGASALWALVILTVGWIISSWAEGAVKKGLARVGVNDSMLRGFFASVVRYAILAVTIIAVLERFGVQTTSVVAILGAAGLAIGLALQGTLANLAAGVMLLLFRPFKVGDSVDVGALSGTIKDVSLFHTQLVTGDNIQVIAPNSSLWATAIKNNSFYADRKVEVLVPVQYSVGCDAAMECIKQHLASDDRVLKDPAPGVALVRFADKYAEISVTFWTKASVAGSVKSDLMEKIWRNCSIGVTS